MKQVKLVIKENKFFEKSKIDTGVNFNCEIYGGTMKAKGDFSLLNDIRRLPNGKSKTVKRK